MRPLLLYPDRQRCRTCRRYFGFVVILRQWCSEECAGVSYNLENAPRSCKVYRERLGGWIWKQTWWSERAVKRACRKKGAGSWYQCDGCWGYHLTHYTPEQWAARQDLRDKQAA